MRCSVVLLLLALPMPGLAAPPELLALFQSERAQAEASLRGLARRGPLQISWSPLRARPTAIRGLAEPTSGQSLPEQAAAFLARHPDLFPTRAELRVLDVQHAGGFSFVRFEQLHLGVPVESAGLVVSLDRSGLVRGVSSEAATIRLASVKPTLDQASAVRAAHLGAGLAATAAGVRPGQARLIILPLGEGRLVYRVVLPFPLEGSGRAHLVDANSGAYLGWRVSAIVEQRRQLEVQP